MPGIFAPRSYIQVAYLLLEAYVQPPISRAPIEDSTESLRALDRLSSLITSEKEIQEFYTILLIARYYAHKHEIIENFKMFNALIEIYSAAHPSICQRLDAFFTRLEYPPPVNEEGYSP